MKHIQTLETRDMAKSLLNGGCGECQTSCQSACKTSCGIANQPCEKTDTYLFCWLGCRGARYGSPAFSMYSAAEKRCTVQAFYSTPFPVLSPHLPHPLFSTAFLYTLAIRSKILLVTFLIRKVT